MSIEKEFQFFTSEYIVSEAEENGVAEVQCEHCDNWECINDSDNPDECDGPEYS